MVTSVPLAASYVALDGPVYVRTASLLSLGWVPRGAEGAAPSPQDVRVMATPINLLESLLSPVELPQEPLDVSSMPPMPPL